MPSTSNEQAAAYTVTPDGPRVAAPSHRSHGQHSFISDSVAALLSSCLYTTATYPIHRIKILLQTQDVQPQILSGQVARYTPLGSVGRLIHEQGMLSLWRGNLPYLLRHVPSTTLSFALKDAIQRRLPCHNPAQQPSHFMLTNLFAGGLAGTLALAVVYPLDFATIRMAANLGPHAPGMYQTIDSTLRVSGFKSLYRGYGVSAMAIGGYKALYFGLYDTAKGLWFPTAEAHRPQDVFWLWVMASGVVYVATTMTYPLDVIRKRLVVDTALPVHQYSGFWDCVHKTWAREGARGFYRFYGYDMALRFGGGALLVMYDSIRSIQAAKPTPSTPDDEPLL